MHFSIFIKKKFWVLSFQFLTNKILKNSKTQQMSSILFYAECCMSGKKNKKYLKVHKRHVMKNFRYKIFKLGNSKNIATQKIII